jgi:DNA-binding FadR family transcriptional regulator
MAAKTSTRGQVAAVVDILGYRIAAGQYQALETLPVEQELADSLEVGRNALREAVKVLSGKGLISTAPRSGTRVRQREDWNMLDPDILRWHADPDIASEKFMLDLIEMRRIVEPKAAELAAVRASRDDVASILSAYEMMAASGDDEVRRIDADIQFHSAILRASHNEVLTHFRHAIEAYLKAHSRMGRELSAAAKRRDLERHQQIAMAVATGKTKSAYSLTVDMLAANRSHFKGS